jgi:hypothetical protein
MDLKFFLNKFAKVDNIENYTLKYLFELRKLYSDYLESTDGQDPDFPMINFGNKGGKVKGSNAASMDEDLGEQQEDSFGL